MRQTFTTILLGLATFTSAAVHAEHRVDAAAFALSVPEHSSPYNGLNLLSDVGGTTQIALKGFDATDGIAWDITSPDVGFSVDSTNWGYAGFAFDVRDGYRITSMTLTGTVTGVLDPGVPLPGGTVGEANNAFSMSWNFRQGGQTIAMDQQTVRDVNGDQQLQLNAHHPFEGSFTMSLESEVYASAQSGVGYWYDGQDTEGWNYIESYASVLWRDAVLTVQVSPVPEPSTWGMLLAGAALLGVAGRKRTK